MKAKTQKTKKTQEQAQQDRTNILDFDLQYDYVLIQAIDTESVGGLVKPNQYDDKPEFGEVIAVGTGRLLEDGTIVPLNMKPGDIIYFGKYSSVQLRSAGEDYFLIRDDDVMAVRKNDRAGKKV